MNVYPLELATIHHRELLAEAERSRRAHQVKGRRSAASRSRGHRPLFGLSRLTGGRR